MQQLFKFNKSLQIFKIQPTFDWVKHFFVAEDRLKSDWYELQWPFCRTFLLISDSDSESSVFSITLSRREKMQKH